MEFINYKTVTMLYYECVSIYFSWLSGKQITFFTVPCYIVTCGLSCSTICFHITSKAAKEVWNTKCMLSFSLQFLSETLLILRIQQDIITNIHSSSHKVPIILPRLQWHLNFFTDFLKKSWNIKVHENPSSGNRDVPWTQTDRQMWQS